MWMWVNEWVTVYVAHLATPTTDMRTYVFVPWPTARAIQSNSIPIRNKLIMVNLSYNNWMRTLATLQVHRILFTFRHVFLRACCVCVYDVRVCCRVWTKGNCGVYGMSFKRHTATEISSLSPNRLRPAVLPPCCLAIWREYRMQQLRMPHSSMMIIW